MLAAVGHWQFHVHTAKASRRTLAGSGGETSIKLGSNTSCFDFPPHDTAGWWTGHAALNVSGEMAPRSGSWLGESVTGRNPRAKWIAGSCLE